MSDHIELEVEFDPDFGVQAPAELGFMDTCALSPMWRRAAETNVKDDESGRQSRLRSFRRRLLDSGIELHPGDDRQLLAMLRAAESDVDGALNVARAFLKYQQYCVGLIPRNIKEMLLDNAKYGRRVMVYKMWDGEKYPYQEITRVYYLMCMTLAREPKTQISGITLVGDMTGLTRRHVPSNWGDIRMWSDFMSGGCPVWFHKIHIINGPWLFEWLYSVAKPFISEHARGVIVYHKKGQLDNLYKEVDRKILPSEFGGEAGPIDGIGCVDAILKLDDYFEETAKTKKTK